MPSLPLPLRFRAYGADSRFRQVGRPPAGTGRNTRMANLLRASIRAIG